MDLDLTHDEENAYRLVDECRKRYHQYRMDISQIAESLELSEESVRFAIYPPRLFGVQPKHLKKFIRVN